MSDELTTASLFGTQIQHMEPLDRVNGFDVRPGFYMFLGATPIPRGVNFTVQSKGATSCELLLYHRKETEPYAVLPFPGELPDRGCVLHDRVWPECGGV